MTIILKLTIPNDALAAELAREGMTKAEFMEQFKNVEADLATQMCPVPGATCEMTLAE